MTHNIMVSSAQVVSVRRSGGMRSPSGDIASGPQEREKLVEGTGTPPDPNPRNLANWCF